MSEILYIQTEKNVEVYQPEVYLQDVAKLACGDSKVLNRNKIRKVFSIPDEKPGRYVISAADLVCAVAKAEPNVDVTHIGEADFIVTYEGENQPRKWISWLKTVLVCVLTFFGGAFSIMTFNNDVDMGSLFSQFYTLVTGKSSSGFTILEISYSIGIGLGVLIFFNHFGHLKLSDDPTPMQVQMRTYEDDVNRTLIEQAARTENPETES